MATSDVELIVSLDIDDPELPKYKRLYTNVPCTLSIFPNRSAVDAINNAAEVAKGDIFIVLSDDFDCFPNWDKTVLRATDGFEDFVLKTYDGTQKWIITMPILDRKYYDRFKYIYYPGYRHMFCDTEFSHVADVLKRVIWRNDIVFRHNHYSNKAAKRDAINVRADATWDQGKALYIERLKNGFGLDIDVDGLSKYAIDHVKWIKHNVK